MMEEVKNENTQELTPEQQAEKVSEREEEALSKMNVYQKLMYVQNKLKAPKGQYNSFGKYKYRSAEDILTGVKPLLYKTKSLLILQDEIEVIAGVQGNYIKAIAKFIDCATGETIETHAFAKECPHKGMSEDQCTGTASSYARKYALNALLLIDDTKDSDSDEVTGADRSNDNQTGNVSRQNNGGYQNQNNGYNSSYNQNGYQNQSSGYQNQSSGYNGGYQHQNNGYNGYSGNYNGGYQNGGRKQ